MDALFNLAPCYCFSCKDDGTLILVNEKLCARLGYSKEELSGEKLETLFTLPTRIFHQTHFFPLLHMQGYADEIFISLQTRAGDYVPVLINAARKESEEDAYTVYVGIEVQNRKRFEDELIAAKKAAEKALAENTALIRAKEALQEHAEALDSQMARVNAQHNELLQFNKVITHDLQEPLRKLSVFAKMILEGPDEAPQKKLVEKLLGVSEHMRQIVSGLQQYIWLSEPSLIRVDVEPASVLLEARTLLQAEFPGINLVMEMDPLPGIQADPAQMRILFYQLLSNVIRFRKAGDRAYVKISAYSLQLNKFRNIADKYSYTGFIKVELADNGIGFNNEYGAQVFELYKRLHPQSGIGIGLALCKKIIENHQGEISIGARDGEGATVTLLLPAKMPGQEANPAETNQNDFINRSKLQA